MDTLPIHTVTAEYGINSEWTDNKGNVRKTQTPPDWHVLWVQPSGDARFPWYVRVRYSAQPGMTNPCTWLVPDLDDPRYDFSQAVAIPRHA